MICLILPLKRIKELRDHKYTPLIVAIHVIAVTASDFCHRQTRLYDCNFAHYIFIFDLLAICFYLNTLIEPNSLHIKNLNSKMETNESKVTALMELNLNQKNQILIEL